MRFMSFQCSSKDSKDWKRSKPCFQIFQCPRLAPNTWMLRQRELRPTFIATAWCKARTARTSRKTLLWHHDSPDTQHHILSCADCAVISGNTFTIIYQFHRQFGRFRYAQEFSRAHIWEFQEPALFCQSRSEATCKMSRESEPLWPSGAAWMIVALFVSLACCELLSIIM